MKRLPKKQTTVKAICNKEIYKEVSKIIGVIILSAMVAFPIAKLAATYTINCCNANTISASQEIHEDLYLSQIELTIAEVKKV